MGQGNILNILKQTFQQSFSGQDKQTLSYLEFVTVNYFGLIMTGAVFSIVNIARLAEYPLGIISRTLG